MQTIKEYVFIIEENTDLDKQYNGEFITEDEEEAKGFFEENFLFIEQYFSKEWENIDGEWIEGKVEIFYRKEN